MFVWYIRDCQIADDRQSFFIASMWQFRDWNDDDTMLIKIPRNAACMAYVLGFHESEENNIWGTRSTDDERGFPNRKANPYRATWAIESRGRFAEKIFDVAQKFRPPQPPSFLHITYCLRDSLQSASSSEGI